MALKDNIVFAYLCQEASGDLLDSSGLAHTMTAVGTPGTTTGKIGAARSLVRTSPDRFTITDHADFRWAGTDSHRVGWFKLAAKATRQCVWSHAGAGEYYYYDETSDRMAWEIKNAAGSTSTIYDTNLGSPPTNTFIFFSLRHDWDGTNATRYMSHNNGTEVSGSLTGGANATGGTFYLGYSAFALPLGGAVDEIIGRKGSMWSGSEVTQIYNGGAGLAYSLWDVNLPALAQYYRRMRA